MLLFKESIVRIFTQQWRKDIESSSKLRTYALVKKYFCVEPYILHTRGNHLITSMARYRMSSHDLNIERGRYNNPITPINQRICTRCELNEIAFSTHRCRSGQPRSLSVTTRHVSTKTVHFEQFC